MFGHVERPVHVARHLVRTRALQKETGGFTEFVPLPFVHMATPIFLQRRARPGPTFREALLIHAVGRIAYRGWIDNIQVSWVKMGVDGARQALPVGRQRPRRHAHGREHLARRRRQPRPGARRGRVPPDRRAARPHRSSSARRSTAGPATVGRRLRPPEEPHGERQRRRRARRVRATALARRTSDEPTARLDVTSRVGNALVDVLRDASTTTSSPPTTSNAGATTMVDLDRADAVVRRPPPRARRSRAAPPPTPLAGLASFGASVAFIGRVRDDQLGKVFTHDLRALGRALRRHAGDRPGRPTGPLPHRGHARRPAHACAPSSASRRRSSGPTTSTRSWSRPPRVTYLEGYLWDQPAAKEAFRKAAPPPAAPAGRSRSPCPTRSASIVTATTSATSSSTRSTCCSPTSDEICSLYEVDDFDAALQHVRRHCEIAALTRSEQGSVDRRRRRHPRHRRRPDPVALVVDTTGAGDQYAAGFLYGLTHGHDLATCGRLGSLAAAEVISHLGARPEVSLAELAGATRPLATTGAIRSRRWPADRTTVPATAPATPSSTPRSPSSSSRPAPTRTPTSSSSCRLGAAPRRATAPTAAT